VTGAAETAIPLASGADHVVVEAWLRQRVGDGVWQFAVARTERAGWTIQNVVAGDPVALSPTSAVFRLQGKVPQRIAFVLRLRREDE
jgi:hypothetical protein